MASNAINSTLNNLGTAIEDFFKGNKAEPIITKKTLQDGGGQTCLEKYGIRLRAEHLEQNEWRKDIVYSRPLVLEEYNIQSEFFVDSKDATVEEQRINYEIDVKKSALKDYKNKQKRSDEEVNKNTK